MRIIFLLFVTLAITILTGCVSPSNNYKPTTKEISFPSVHKTVVAEIGDELVKHGTYTEQDAILLASPVKPNWAYEIGSGVYLKRGSDGSREYFYPNYNDANSGKITKATIADPWQYVSYDKNKDKIGIVTIFNVNIAKDANGNVTYKKFPSLAENSFQQTLTYRGCIDEKIALEYREYYNREFSNSNSRPASSIDFEHDLKKSEIIDYKGARIDVIEADNQKITYKLLSNFNSH